MNLSTTGGTHSAQAQPPISPPSADSILVRGTPVIGLCHFLEKELGSAGRAAVFAKIPEPWSGLCRTGTLLASHRVPLTVVNLLTSAGAEARGEAVEVFAERAGTFGAREGISTVFKPFFYILSVANALDIAPLMWGRIYDAGKMRVESHKVSAKIHITAFPGDPAVCGRISGWFRYIGELSGAKNLRLRHAVCTSRGDSECLWEFDWE